MDLDFIKLCLCIISLYKERSTTKEACEHLLKCLNAECLTRDNYEIILRILLREAFDRKLVLAEYLGLIAQDKDLAPETYTVSVKSDEF